MDTIFSYELRREQPLSTEEKQRIRVILDAYRIKEEQLSSWNGDSCSLPLFRCFEVPLLYSEHIRIADSETAYTAAAHWCCMLDALQEALSGVVISAVMQEAVVHDAEHGFLIPSMDREAFLRCKRQERVEAALDSPQSEEPVLFTEQAPLYATRLYLKPLLQQKIEQQVAAFEARLQILLPACYRDFLIRYNGGAATDTYFYMENAGETVYCLDQFYGFHEGDTGFPAMSRCLWFTELLEQGYLCIAGDAFGNHIVLRIRENGYGGVFFYAHDNIPRFHALSSDFFHFMMQVQSHIDVLQPSAALTQVYICRLEDDSQDARVQKRPLDVFLEGEMAADKAERVQQLMEEAEPRIEGFLHFDTFAFRLAVIEELMYVQKLLPSFELYDKLYELHVDPEGDFRYHGPLLYALRYFKELRIPVALAEHVESLTLDGGNEIYGQIMLEWDGEYSLFDIADVKERELKQFGNLKQVAVNGLAEPAFVRSLRMQGIRVTDRFDEQDYACEKLQHLLTNWETCCVYAERSDAAAQLLAALRYCMGGYYKELFHPSLQHWEQLHETGVAKDTLLELAKQLQTLGLTLMRYEPGIEGCCLLVTRNITACIALLKKDARYTLVQHCGVWSIKETNQPTLTRTQSDTDPGGSQRQEEAGQICRPQPEMRKQMSRMQKRVLFAVCAAVLGGIALFIINSILVSNQETIWDENLNYDYQVVCKGNDGDCQLRSSDGALYFTQPFQESEPTYSSLLAVREYNNRNYDRIYDVTQRKFLHGDFLHVRVVELKEDGEPMEYRGLLATKDKKNYMLYSEKHKNGIRVKPDTYGSVGYGPFDVDTGVEWND